MTRDLILIANWKMYKTIGEAADYIDKLAPEVEGCHAKIFLAVPFTAIAPAVLYAKELPFVIGAQNMSDAKEGAFTGEISTLMLQEAGAGFVLLGHSERRRVFQESEELIHRKVFRALQDKLRPVLCVGETFAERNEGETEAVLLKQISSALKGLKEGEVQDLILAYEPVWAIGTGMPATPTLAQESHVYCRNALAKLFGKKTASHIPILYGGSVQPENAAVYTAEEDIDGVLVGGASLDPHKFAQIIKHVVGKK